MSPSRGFGVTRADPHFHPGVVQRLFFPLPGGLRGGGQDRAAGQGPQLPAGQPGRLPDDELLHGGGVLVVEAGQFLGDDLGAPLVDQPALRRVSVRVTATSSST